MANQGWTHRFIQHLEKLHKRKDRGALAILRRGLNRQAGVNPEMYSVGLPIPEKPYLEDAAFLVAPLFALHPQSGGRGTLGTAFATLVAKNHESKESLERRFTTLLNCHRDDLPTHLRQAISLLRSKEVPIDWRQLLQNIFDWDDDARRVQRAWARDFWRSSTTGEDTNAADSE